MGRGFELGPVRGRRSARRPPRRRRPASPTAGRWWCRRPWPPPRRRRSAAPAPPAGPCPGGADPAGRGRGPAPGRPGRPSRGRRRAAPACRRENPVVRQIRTPAPRRRRSAASAPSIGATSPPSTDVGDGPLERAGGCGGRGLVAEQGAEHLDLGQHPSTSARTRGGRPWPGRRARRPTASSAPDEGPLDQAVVAHRGAGHVEHRQLGRLAPARRVDRPAVTTPARMVASASWWCCLARSCDEKRLRTTPSGSMT